MHRRVQRLRTTSGSHIFGTSYTNLKQTSVRCRSSVVNQEQEFTSEYKQLERFSSRILKAAANRDKDPGWSYGKTRAGEESRLKEVLRASQQPVRVASREKTQFFTQSALDTGCINDITDISTVDQSFEPGCFVELRRYVLYPIRN